MQAMNAVDVVAEVPVQSDQVLGIVIIDRQQRRGLLEQTALSSPAQAGNDFDDRLAEEGCDPVTVERSLCFARLSRLALTRHSYTRTLTRCSYTVLRVACFRPALCSRPRRRPRSRPRFDLSRTRTASLRTSTRRPSLMSLFHPALPWPAARVYEYGVCRTLTRTTCVRTLKEAGVRRARRVRRKPARRVFCPRQNQPRGIWLRRTWGTA